MRKNPIHLSWPETLLLSLGRKLPASFFNCMILCMHAFGPSHGMSSFNQLETQIIFLPRQMLLAQPFFTGPIMGSD